MKQLKQSDIKPLRNEILKKQNYTCPLCGKHITENDRITLDHQHKLRKSDVNGVNGNGQIRGVLCSDCNALEGKIFNNQTRFLNQPSIEGRIRWLQNLIKYYNQDLYPYIHPSEAEKPRELSKRNFNKLKKEYKLKYPNKKELEYPKSKKITKQLILLYNEFNINPYN